MSRRESVGWHISALLAMVAILPAAAVGARHAADEPVERFPVIEGISEHAHPITAAAPQSQRFFNQGMRLLFAFNHDEAIRAFRAVVDVDPHCAMAYWGIAYALGPNYNLEADPERDKEAYAALEKAQRYAKNASPREADYIAALSKRYSATPEGADRKVLDEAYAAAMRELAQKYPDDLDASVLFAEAMMNLRPWALWTRDGKPEPGTEEILATLERVLEKNPDHPGAIHYYIHAVEASREPQRALEPARRLAGIAPAAGHLVHMPAHIYMRLGLYADAAEANRQAVKADRAYIERCRPSGIYPMMYYPHNIHFLWSSLCFMGCAAEALQSADELSALMTEDMVREMPMIEAFVPTRLFTLVRFGRWDQILEEPAPPEDFQYAMGMWHYARGLAFAYRGKQDDAQRELARLRAIREATPEDKMAMQHPAVDLLRIGEHVLAGRLAAKTGKTDDAVSELQKAIDLQDSLRYDEPPPWYYPVRQSLGAVLLEAGRPAEAEKVYRAELEQFPDNGWSLFGLAESLKAQQSDEAPAVVERWKKAWQHADHKPTSSEF